MLLKEFLKKYRAATDFSGRALAERIGVSKHSLEKWENAGAMPNFVDGKKLMDYFGFADIGKISKKEYDQCVATANARIAEKILPELKSNVLRESDDNDFKSPKDLLIEEKDKRIADLEKLIAQQAETIELLKRLMEKDGEGGVSPF